jgi:hypothetical protein
MINKLILLLCLQSGVMLMVNGQSGKPVAKKQLTEAEKIEYLLNSIENIEGAQFYRNGSWYDAIAAASHLRMKLSKAENRIKTAQDFIDRIASVSSTTGEAYKIKFNDGKILSATEYFTGRLKELEGN